jgi:hypothetical protein
LNGYQFLTIRDAQKLVAGINDRMSAYLVREIPETLSKPASTWEPFDKESLERILKAAREKHPWLELRPGRLSFTLPGAQTVFERGRREVLQFPELEKLRKEAGNPEQADERAALKAMGEAVGRIERNAEWLSQLPLSFDLRKDRMTLALGFGDGEPMILKTLKQSQEKRPFEKELTAHARTLEVPFRDNVTVETLIAEFLEQTGHHAGTEGTAVKLWQFLSSPAFVAGLVTGILGGWLAYFLRTARKRHRRLAAPGEEKPCG